jgi:hypothetical protein
MIYLLLKHFHSGLRWIALILLIYSISNSLFKYIRIRKFTDSDKKLLSLTTSTFHLQFIIGLILYFVSPKVVFSAESMTNPFTRFFLVEHAGVMLVTVILITLCSVQVRKIVNDHLKHRKIVFYYVAVLLLVLVSVPWPWQPYAAGLF